jgi:hypothetical protein
MKNARPTAKSGANSLPVEYVYVSSASVAATASASETLQISLDAARHSASRQSAHARGYAAVACPLKLRYPAP